jgi:hypothetical protein
VKIWLDDERDPRAWVPSKPWHRKESSVDDWTWIHSAWAAILFLANRLRG